MRTSRPCRAAAPPRPRSHAGAFVVARATRPAADCEAAAPSFPADAGIERATGTEAMPPVLQRLEALALQELASAQPMADAIGEHCDVLSACIGWDLGSPAS